MCIAGANVGVAGTAAGIDGTCVGKAATIGLFVVDCTDSFKDEDNFAGGSDDICTVDGIMVGASVEVVVKMVAPTNGSPVYKPWTNKDIKASLQKVSG